MTWEDDEIAALVAALYYNYKQFGYSKRLRQEDIAVKVGISREEVIKLLHHAKNADIVQFTVVSKGERDMVGEYQLLSNVKSKNGTPLLDPDVTRIVGLRIESLPDEIIRWEVAQMAANLLRDLIEKQTKTRNIVIGVSLGRTLKLMAELMQAIQEPDYSVTIVPTTGLFGGDLEEVESTTVCHEIHRRLGISKPKCHSFSLPSPGYVSSSEVKQALLEIPLTQEVVQLWTKADILLSGVGAMTDGATSLSLWKQVTESDFELLKTELKTAGDLTLNFIDSNGGPISDWQENPDVSMEAKQVLQKIAHPVATNLDELRKVAKAKGRHSIVVGAGTAKANAFVAGIRGGYIDGIVTDCVTSREIVRLWNL